jgi:hypothetical protein
VNRSTAANQALDVARSNADARDPILLPDEGAYHQELTARGVQLLVSPSGSPYDWWSLFANPDGSASTPEPRRCPPSRTLEECWRGGT